MLRTLTDRSYEFARERWPLLILLVVGVAIGMRIHWAFRVIALILLVVVVVLVLLGAAVSLYDVGRNGVHEPKFLLRLAARAEQARSRLRELTKERTDISDKIASLRTIGDGDGSDISGKQWGKSLALLEAYQGERDLRDSKIGFYRLSLKRLTELEEKWRQERRLNELQQDLERLRKPDQREAGHMKALRAELAYEDKLLSTYQDLSKQLDRVDTLEGATTLRDDLDRLLNS